jgi:WG containing repeat
MKTIAKITLFTILILSGLPNGDRVVDAKPIPQPAPSPSVEQLPKLPSFMWTGTYMFSENRARIRVLTNGFERYGYIDRTGKMVIPPTYLFNSNFSQGLAAVQFDNQKYGFIDLAGKTVIPPQFDEAYSFTDGLAVVKVGDKMGAIDRQGKFIVQPIYKNTAWEYQDGLLAVEQNNLWGFVDTKGKMAIAPQFMMPKEGTIGTDVDIAKFFILRFSEGLAAASKDGITYGYIDKQGKMVIPFVFKYARAFSEGYGLVQLPDGKWVFLDRTGYPNIFLPRAKNLSIAEAALLSNFSEGLAGVKIGDKWGFINRTADEVIPRKFDNIYPFSEGLAGVQIGGKYGFIDRQGKQVIPPKFDRVFSFKNGFAPVTIGEHGTVNAKVGYIDKQGKLTISSPLER